MVLEPLSVAKDDPSRRQLVVCFQWSSTDSRPRLRPGPGPLWTSSCSNPMPPQLAMTPLHIIAVAVVG
jgi:hypothetical protein